MPGALAALLDATRGHASRFLSRFDAVQDAQAPDAVTVCCSDSRVLQDQMWGNETPGRLFTCANIGNRVVQRTDDGDVISGDVLYPIHHTGTELVIVVGHTGCGAVTAAYDSLTEGVSGPSGIEHCLELVASQLEPGVERLPADLDRAAVVNRLVEYHVDRQLERLDACDDVHEDVTLVGAVYDFQDVYSGRRGEVHVINIDGERGVDELRESHPDIAPRIERRWEY
jgi:carbonic anhydrase